MPTTHAFFNSQRGLSFNSTLFGGSSIRGPVDSCLIQQGGTSMQRRSFIKTATVATLAATIPQSIFASVADKKPRIAFGGIGIECSTYSRIRARMEDFSVLTGDALTSSDR